MLNIEYISVISHGDWRLDQGDQDDASLPFRGNKVIDHFKTFPFYKLYRAFMIFDEGRCCESF